MGRTSRRGLVSAALCPAILWLWDAWSLLLRGLQQPGWREVWSAPATCVYLCVPVRWGPRVGLDRPGWMGPEGLGAAAIDQGDSGEVGSWELSAPG